MAFTRLAATFTRTTAAAAGTEVDTAIGGLSKYDRLVVVADLIGITGGTLDVYLQREIETDVWTDWLHFPQLAAAAAAVNYACSGETSLVMPAVGIGSLAAPGVALAAGVCVGGHPGDKLRAVYVSGAGTSAGAAQTIYVTGWCAK